MSFLLPLSVANCSPVRCCVNVYVHSLCRAAGVLEWQESGGRARASCSQRCAATGRVRCVQCRRRDGGYLSRCYSAWLGLASLLLDAASAPPLSACAALQYRRCFPAASATRRLDQVPVEPGLLLRLLLQSCWGVHPPLPLWRQGDHLRNPSGMVAPRQRQDLFSSSSTARTTSRRVPCFARRATAAAAGTLSPQRSPWSQPPRRRVGWSFSVAGASSRRLRLPRSIGC